MAAGEEALARQEARADMKVVDAHLSNAYPMARLTPWPVSSDPCKGAAVAQAGRAQLFLMALSQGRAELAAERFKSALRERLLLMALSMLAVAAGKAALAPIRAGMPVAGAAREGLYYSKRQQSKARAG